MNKSDLKLLIMLGIIIIGLLSLFRLFLNHPSNEAKVYFDGQLILTINLTIDRKYEVDGFLGPVLIEVKNKKIRVEKENSPLHLCSQTGFVNNLNTPLICLPNKIVIKSSVSNNIDAIVK